MSSIFVLAMDQSGFLRPGASPYPLPSFSVFGPVASPGPSQMSTSRQSGPAPKPKPSNQELYNRWRKLEDELGKTDEVQAKRKEKKMKDRRAARMARHPSSTGSLRQQLENTDIQETKRKGGRKGPLDPVAKARTAFRRQAKLVCTSCKDTKRRVSVPPIRSPASRARRH